MLTKSLFQYSSLKAHELIDLIVFRDKQRVKNICLKKNTLGNTSSKKKKLQKLLIHKKSVV